MIPWSAPVGAREWRDDGYWREVRLDELSRAERTALDPGVPNRLDRRPDVLVVGGGIMGVATAVACEQAALGSVLLVEADHLGGGATGGSAGLLLPEAHQGTDPSRLVELGRLSLGRWRQLQAVTPGGVGLVDLLWIGLAPHPDGFVADPPPTARWLTTGDVGDLIPDLVWRTTAAAVPNQARLNPLRAVSRLAAGLSQRGDRSSRNRRYRRARTHRRSVDDRRHRRPRGCRVCHWEPAGPRRTRVVGQSRRRQGHLLVTEPTPVRLPGTVAPIATQLGDGGSFSGGTLDIGDDSPGVREAGDRGHACRPVSGAPLDRRSPRYSPVVLLAAPSSRRTPSHLELDSPESTTPGSPPGTTAPAS